MKKKKIPLKPTYSTEEKSSTLQTKPLPKVTLGNQKLVQEVNNYLIKSGKASAPQTQPKSILKEYTKMDEFRNRVLPLVETATNIGQVGNFIPHPVAQAVGKASSVLGASIDGAQALKSALNGDYQDATVNAGAAMLSKLTGSRTSKAKYLIPGNRTKFLEVSKNVPLATGLAGETAYDAKDIPTMKYKKGTKKFKVKKAAQGLQEVTVPPAGDNADILGGAISGATTGASVGGPIGAAVGGAIGLASGIFNKSAQDEARAKARKKNAWIKTNNQYAGNDVTLNQKSQVYKKGTKLVEVEGGEPVFTKNNGKFKLKADIKGPSHKEGGIPMVVEEGDIIFPKTKRAAIMTKYKKKDFKGIEKERMKLPEDTPKAARGLNYKKKPNKTLPTDKEVEDSIYASMQRDNKIHNENLLPTNEEVENNIIGRRNIAYKTPAFEDIANPYPTSSNMNAPSIPMGDLMKGSTSLVQDSPATPAVPGKGLNLNKALSYGNMAYNLIKGMGSPETVQRREYKPKQLTYTDRSDPNRIASTQANNVAKYNARNLGGGNINKVAANLNQAGVDNFYRQSQINNTEMGRSDEINNQNTQIGNQAGYTNTMLQNQYDDQDAQNRAANRSFMGAAINEGTSIAQQGIVDQNANEGDMRRLGFYDSIYQNYRTTRDKDGNPIGVEVKSKGSKGIKTNYKKKK